MYEASKGRHWPPLAQGLEAHGSACWHDFPEGEQGERVKLASQGTPDSFRHYGGTDLESA
jgi:hypothetical protein